MQSQILPSRAALVDRIAMQFEYGQSLISLVGSSGLGKSYLAETFITDKYPEFNKAYISLSANTKDTELMTQLLQHSFRSPLVDQTLSLSENFYSLYQEQQCGPCLWVLDGARHLSDEMIEQLRILATRSPVQLFILITAQAPRSITGALDIHLETLSLHESKQLMSMFFNQLPMDEDPVFNTFLKESHGNPAVLLSWEAEQQVDLRENKPKSGLHLHLIALVMILALCIIAFFYQKQLLSIFTPTAEISSIETVLTPNQVLNESEPVTSEDDEQNSTDDQAQSVEAVLQTQHAHSETPIELATSQDVNAILSALESSVRVQEKPNQEKQLEQAASPEHRDPEASDEETSEASMVKAHTENAAVVLTDEQWLTQQSDQLWAIQLLAVKDKAIATSFVLANQLTNTYVYETLRNDVSWWVVVQAPYENTAQARAGIQSLPQAVQAGQPFLKKIQRIKQEIALSTR